MAASSQKLVSDPTFFLIVAPWDFSSGKSGIDVNATSAIFDQLRGEVGLTGLSLWGAASAWREFSVKKTPHLHRCEGGLFFDPLQSRGGCRPPAAASLSRRLVPEIAEACRQHGLSLRLNLSLARMGGLAEFYPEFASRNAFGDSSSVAVCLLNPAVQDCMKSLTVGVPPQLGVDQVILHDVRVGWLEAFDPEIRWPAPLGATEQSLLSTCFCANCIKTSEEAGLDHAASRMAVANLVRRSLSGGTAFGGRETGFLGEQPELAAYRGFQADQLSDFLQEIVEETSHEVFVARTSAQAVDPFQAGIPAGVITSVTSLSEAAHSISNARRSEVTVPAVSFLGHGAEEFVAATSELPKWGCSGVQIDNYAALPDAALTTLKQAIRFARRSFTL